MKITIDLKSVIFGVFIGIILITTYSFNQPQENNSIRYQATSGERGFIILDTYTGKYLLDSEVNYIGNMRWIKGDFDSAYEAGRNKTKQKK